MSDQQANGDKRRMTPSIIVDPSLAADEELHSDLSAAEADRLADSIRPSWAPSKPPADDAPPQSEVAVVPQESQAALELEREETALMAGARRSRRRGRLAAGGTIVAALLLLALGWMSASGPSPVQPAQGRTGKIGQTPQLTETTPPAELRNSTAAATAPAEQPNQPSAPVGAAPGAIGPTTTAATSATEGSSVGRAEQKTGAPPVTFRIRTVPRRARLFVDGRRVKNPFDGEVPGGREIAIEAHAKRHAPTRLTAKSDRDRIIGVSLKRLRKARPRRR